MLLFSFISEIPKAFKKKADNDIINLIDTDKNKVSVAKTDEYPTDQRVSFWQELQKGGK